MDTPQALSPTGASADSEFRPKHEILPLLIGRAQPELIPRPLEMEDALQHLTASRPRYEILHPTGVPKRDPLNLIPFPLPEGVSAREVFVRSGSDPGPQTLLASGAERVPPSESRMLDGEG